MVINFSKYFLKRLIDKYFVITKSFRSVKPLSYCRRVILLAETGTRDFIPRLAQANELWKRYKIPSIVLHKHFLSSLSKNDFKNTLVIDKSATLKCLSRFRYCRLRGAVTSVIPEELIVVNNDHALIAAALHKYSIAQIDYLIGGGEMIEKYAMKNNVKMIKCKNPRFNINEIDKVNEELKIKKVNHKKDFLLINDNSGLAFSSLPNEEELIKKLFWKSNYSGTNYLNIIKKEEEESTENLIKLVKELEKKDIFKNLDIIIRPHPSIDLKLYKKFMISKLPKTARIKIIRDGSALNIMKNATAIFHHNCTTGVEAYYAGLTNTFNFASKPRFGYAPNIDKYIPCLGIEDSIKLCIKKIKNKQLKNYNPKKYNDKNLYEILGKEMNKSHAKFSNIKSLDRLEKIFKNKKVIHKSALDRWDSANKIIELLKIKKKENFLVLGSVGVVVGNWD